MQKLRIQTETFIGRAIDAVLPPRCALTGEIVEKQGMIAPKAWVSLDFIAAPYCACCGFPFGFEAGAESLCAACLLERPAYQTARSALKYNDASRDLILGFKHADQLHLVKSFLPWLKKAGADMLEDADAIIPVPLHFWRLVKRRYNQAGLIAHTLGKDLGKAVWSDALKRVRATPSQGHLNANQRHKNVKRAFALNPKLHVRGKKIVLIDDVYTTGATVGECTKILLAGGAARVDVLTIARVVRAAA